MNSVDLLMFPPLHKRALGTAIGVWAALVVFSLTALTLLQPDAPAPDLSLLNQYFTGYTVSWRGAVVGGAWAGVAGFTAGWFLALVRNLVIGLALLYLRSRTELAQARDFLDHI